MTGRATPTWISPRAWSTASSYSRARTDVLTNEHSDQERPPDRPRESRRFEAGLVRLGGERLTEMAVLRDAGCVAFSHADTPLPDTQVLWRAMQYASTFGFAVWLRPQDGFLARDGVAHDGDVATRLGLPGIPVFAETIALATILQLVRATRTRVHLCRLSTAEGVAMLRAAKKEGLPVSCDASAHHVHLSEIDLSYFDARCHVIPPF